ncbi:MAG: tripartite tricarboxylate transporter substrate-binding protein [Reyranellaceae bacterium]
MISRRTFTAAAGALVATRSAHAQQAGPWPSKPIRIVCGFSVGTTTDLLARLLAQKLTERLGGSVVVENRPGAGGTIAAAQVARAVPDGHTLMLASLALTLAPRLFNNLTFRPIEDFQPIGLMGYTPNVLLCGLSVPITSIAELIEQARKAPGKLRYASSGPGSGSWIGCKLLEVKAGIVLEEVPYASTAQATNDALGGQVELHCPSLAGGMPLVKDGRLRPLGVTSAKRSAAAPDVPSIAETVPGYDASAWYGVVGPAGMPEPVVHRLNEEMQIILNDRAVQAVLGTAGLDVETGNVGALRTVMADAVLSGNDLMDRIGYRPQ